MENIESLYSNSSTPSFLVNVILERKDGKGTYEIFANQSVGAGNDAISEIKINQNIFSPFISGFIELYDKGDWTGELNLTTFENIILKFTLDEENLIEVKCRIYEAKLVNDISRAPRLNNIEKVNLYRLEFLSEPVFNFEFKENFLKDKDFVGLISTEKNNSNLKGLINEISDKYNLKPIEVETTQNGVWIKKDEISIPTGIERGQFSITHLLNYVTSYAIGKENAYAPNFFLWQDLDGWHFKSIEKLLKEQKDKSIDSLEYFVLNTDDATDPRKIRTINVINQYNSMSLLKDKTLTSYYKRVEPNFKNPYSDFLSSNGGFTYSIIDYDYHRDFDKVLRVEKNKLVPKTVNTAAKQNGYYSSINRVYGDVHSYANNDKYNTPFHYWYDNSADRGFGVPPDNIPIVWWDYIGRTADSRWSNVTWQPQFDICDLDIQKFHDIHTKIREPLRAKREEFAHKKDIKRQWEVYRCAVCCMGNANYGGTADIKLLNDFKETSGITFNLLYGPTGIFADMEQTYKVVAAGSFTDAVNYDIAISGSQNGLTLSYDFTKEPYNQTIGQFYNIKEEIPNFIKYSLEQSIALYDQAIDYYNKRIEIIESFVNNADDYIASANAHFSANVVPLQKDESGQYTGLPQYSNAGSEGARYYTSWQGPSKYPFLPNPPTFQLPGFDSTPFPYRQVSSGYGYKKYNYSFGLDYIRNEAGEVIGLKNAPVQSIPDFVKRCSKERYMVGFAKVIANLETYELITKSYSVGSVVNPIDQSTEDVFFVQPQQYNISTRGLLEGIYYQPQSTDTYSVPDGIQSQYEEAARSLRQCLDDGNCFNELCFDSIVIEIQKRIGEQELQIVKFERDIYLYLKNLVQNTFIPKWKELYKEWWNRKAFFASKQIGSSIFTGVTGGRQTKLAQPLSLQNIKSIKRKEIKGSRYEILAKSKLGVTGASAGEWLYNIFFGNDETKNPNQYQPENNKTWWETAKVHPYYNQRYDSRYGKSAFITKRSLNYWYEYSDANPLNAPPFQSENLLPLPDDEQKQTAYLIANEKEIEDINLEKVNLGYSLTHLNYMEPIVESDFVNGFNIFEENIFDKKPPNIKKEEISSYVRIEFLNPIGLDRISDFPNGFVRDAGSEYFLPYLVQLTAGPNGRQTIRNNVTIIGMDPYGFDVAVKKSKVENRNDARSYSWWKTYSPVNFGSDLSDAGMDLWPEKGFNVETPYYTTDVNSSIPQLKDGYAFDFYYWERGGLNTRNPGFSSMNVDKEYRETALGSGYLLASHKKIKPHRSWWSFYIPSNLFLKQKTYNPSLGLAYSSLNPFGFNSFYGYDRGYAGYMGEYRGPILDYSSVTNKNNYGYWWYSDINAQTNSLNNRLDSRWIELSYTNDTVELLNQYDLNTKLMKRKNQDGSSESVQIHTENSIQENYPELKRYFENDLLHWLSADYALYRPGLVTDDVWKYDLSGETDYGLTTPPVDEANYDIFDQNFAAQFVVFAKTTSVCDKFTCANPNGITDTSDCPEDNPYCNCPAQDQMPTEPEPTYLDLYNLYNEIKECDLIEEHLGEDYLGCMWIDPNNPCSCNCPEIGKKYHEYLKYSRTYATFWGTPPHVPLHRTAYLNQLTSQQIIISVSTNPNIKIGDLVYVYHENPREEGPSGSLFLNKDKNLFGKWLVIGINHGFYKETVQYMELTLARDTLPVSPDIGGNPQTAFML